MRLRWVVFWAAAGLSAAMLVTTVRSELDRQKRMAAVIREKDAQLAAAQDRLDRLRNRVQFYRTEEGQAWLAREKLNMAFSGEEIYKIEGEVPPAETQKKEE